MRAADPKRPGPRGLVTDGRDPRVEYEARLVPIIVEQQRMLVPMGGWDYIDRIVLDKVLAAIGYEIHSTPAGEQAVFRVRKKE